MTRPAPRPLQGTTVLDVSRMLPGAIVARMLADLGARVIKVEAPLVGDPMRSAVPTVGGIGAAFGALYRGAESISLDLRQASDAAAFRALAGHADVLLESFRPGTLEGWGIDPPALLAQHPGLTICSLTSFGREGPRAGRVAHDINFVATSGLLSQLPGTGMPRVQIADVAAGLLATSAILAALLGRATSGRGGWIDQPLSTGSLPFMTVALAEYAAGGGGMAETLLGGAIAAYRLYTCADGERLAVGTLEPKFWAKFVEILGLPELAAVGLAAGPAGRRAAEQVQEALAARPREHWLALVEQHNLPVTPVVDVAGAARELGDERLVAPGPFLPSLGMTPERRAPGLGEHTRAILAEFGIAASDQPPPTLRNSPRTSGES